MKKIVLFLFISLVSASATQSAPPAKKFGSCMRGAKKALNPSLESLSDYRFMENPGTSGIRV